MRPINEHYYPTNETDMRFEALQMLRATQASLTELNFLEVISLMRTENPLKKDVLKFEEDLNDLTNRIGAFIQKAKNDVEYQPSPEEIDAEADEPEEKEDEPEEKEEKEPKEEPKDNQKQKDMKAAGNSDKSDKKKSDKKEKPVKEQFFDSSASTV